MAKEREALEKLEVNRAPGAGGGVDVASVPRERRLGDRHEAEVDHK